ncbi:hypothetical protein KGF56_004274 [Candida oxycetoniae]|uniref:Uncharacterized protein n=1 Tax=Candida oxycetoniae TaxID=497107 RepID=A0AAI9WWC4_9ASCO|nr:uncharacterized protein KGF56_004274 [Candida oxycetoniae]KAI3403021.2 hypothetical protein KGF56_004274 [Candida oxycetoniae]
MSQSSPPPPPLLPPYSIPCEKLPLYEPSINFQGLALLKTEFLTPYHYNNGKRSWKPVILYMNSTQLKIYSLKANKQLHDLIVNLYFEINSLNQLTIDINTEYKKKNNNNNKAKFNFANNSYMDGSGSGSGSGSGIDNMENDVFSGDAYGGCDFDTSKSIFKESKFQKLKEKIKSQKTEKIMSHIKDYYHQLKDNKLLFEPAVTSDGTDEQYATFNKYKGLLIHSYSLSHLQVGEAPSLNQLISAMYKEDQSASFALQNVSSLVKYKNTLRLRIEYKQILLQFWSFHAMISWFRNLMIGRDLSIPLESRTITRLKSIPSRYSSRNNALLAATAAAASFGRDGSNIQTDTIDENEQVAMFTSHSLMTSKDDSSSTVSSNTGLVLSDGENSSIFDNESQRRSSIASTTFSDTTIGTKTLDTITIKNFQFKSNEHIFNTVEKQYISNCIPDLNSFDKWNGKLVTISNSDSFVKDVRTFKNRNDVFISYSVFSDYVTIFDKKFPHQENLSKHNNKICATRTFLIHQDGLVGI